MFNAINKDDFFEDDFFHGVTVNQYFRPSNYLSIINSNVSNNHSWPLALSSLSILAFFDWSPYKEWFRSVLIPALLSSMKVIIFSLVKFEVFILCTNKFLRQILR